MASLPLVSIIIPCYNGERFVAEAIESALAQTYPHKEVIVIDDGSTDNSLEVIKSFGDKIRWETGPNRGGCAARNRGIELARGELIQFLDADDLLHPQKLEKQVSFMIGGNYDWTICWGQVIPPNDACAPVYRRPYCGEDPLIFNLLGGLQTSASIHKKENLTRVNGFDETLPCSQERDLHIRLAMLGLRLGQLREYLFTVRRTAGSVSSNSQKVFRGHYDLAIRYWEMLKAQPGFDESRARALAAFAARAGRMLARGGALHEAKKFFVLSKKIHPSGGFDLVYGSRARALLKIMTPQTVELLFYILSALIENFRLRRSSSSNPRELTLI